MNKIKVARHKAGMTQRQLADKSSVNIRQIQKVESGETSTGSMAARNLIAIADALGVHPRDLLEDSDKRSEAEDAGPEEVPSTYIPLAVYARQQGRLPSDARQLARQEAFTTARKAGGRDWFVDPSEPWPIDRRRKKN